MPLQVSAQQAACNALAAYLSAHLPGVKCRARWPEANAPLEARAVTVIIAGVREDVPCGHVVVSQTNLTASTASYTWKVLQCRLPLQLDVWATNDVERDDLAASVDVLMNRGTSQLTGVTNQDPFGEGTALNLLTADGYTGIADFIFDSSRPMDVPDAVQRAEYRATARGDARFVLVQTQTSPRLVAISLKAKVHEVVPAPTGQLFDITTLLNTGAVIHTTGS